MVVVNEEDLILAKEFWWYGEDVCKLCKSEDVTTYYEVHGKRVCLCKDCYNKSKKLFGLLDFAVVEAW